MIIAHDPQNFKQHATNNTLLLRCVWMTKKHQMVQVNEASFSGARINATRRIPANSHAERNVERSGTKNLIFGQKWT